MMDYIAAGVGLYLGYKLITRTPPPKKEEGVTVVEYQVQREKGDPWDRHSGFATRDDANDVKDSLLPAVEQGALGGVRVRRVVL